MWKNIAQPDEPQMKTRHMRIVGWIIKATYVHTECVILIAFPGINVCTNTPKCYVILLWPVLFIITLLFTYPKHKSPAINTNVTHKKFNFLVPRNVQTLLKVSRPCRYPRQRYYYPKTLPLFLCLCYSA
jgi:hypothetical protein